MKLKRIAAALLALLLCGLPFAAPAYADTAEQNAAYAQSALTGKNEMVYALLGYDGSAGEIYVVNQLLGSYTDYGNYTSIKNLSTVSEPVIEGDKITFPDDPVESGLYYQGTMEGELPMTFTFRYYLNGATVEAGSLGGASGHIIIDIGCTQNEQCDARVREGLMAQITLNMDLSLARNIEANGATTVITGNTMSIVFTVLPGGGGDFTLEADVTDFKMDGIAVALVQSVLGGYEDTISEYEEDFDDMLSGADDMVDGTVELKDGVSALVGGIGNLSDGLSRLDASGSDTLSGMRQYGTGLQDYTQGVVGIAAASEDVLSGFNKLSGNGATLTSGLEQINGNLNAMAGNAELRAVAQSLSSSSDPSVQALANGTLSLLNGISGISAGLEEASGGISDYVAGVQQAALVYGEIHAALVQAASEGDDLVSAYNDITEGFESYASGVGSSASGAKRLYWAANGLPVSIQELIDGQTEFRDGISAARDGLLEQTEDFSCSAPVSFASPEKNHPRSVQYVLMSPAIDRPDAEAETLDTKEEETFLSRLLDLFR